MPLLPPITLQPGGGNPPSVTQRRNTRNALNATEGLSAAIAVTSDVVVGETYFGKVMTVTGSRIVTFPSASLHPGRRLAIVAEAGGLATLVGDIPKLGAGAISVIEPFRGFITIEAAGGSWRATTGSHDTSFHTVVNSTARKNPTTYASLNPAVEPYLGMLVRQTDLPERAFLLTDLDVTQDASWFGIVGIDTNGNLLVSGIVPSSFTAAEALEDVPAEGELAFREDATTGRYGIVKGNGLDVAAALPDISGANANFITPDNPPFVRAGENWKVWGVLTLEEDAYIDIEEGGSIQLL